MRQPGDSDGDRSPVEHDHRLLEPAGDLLPELERARVLAVRERQRHDPLGRLGRHALALGVVEVAAQRRLRHVEQLGDRTDRAVLHTEPSDQRAHAFHRDALFRPHAGARVHDAQLMSGHERERVARVPVPRHRGDGAQLRRAPRSRSGTARTTGTRGRTCRATDARTSSRATAVRVGVLEAVGSPRPLLRVWPLMASGSRGRAKLARSMRVQQETSGGARVPPGRAVSTHDGSDDGPVGVPEAARARAAVAGGST